MTQITQSTAIAAIYAGTQKTNQKTGTQKTASADSAAKKSKVSGATVGTPELSEKAQEYYEQLKKKFSNMDFILVSEDMKATAQANAASYANPNRMVVLIDEDKIERMAEDENYRKQYEGIISMSAQLSELSQKLGSNASKLKGCGIQVKDGMASFFAVVDKSLESQKKRIEKKAEEKAADKKADTKKRAEKAAAKKQAEKAAEEKQAEKAAEEGRAGKATDAAKAKGEDVVVVTASSVEELIQKINDAIYGSMSDHVLTEEERQIGGKFDYYG